MFNSKQNENIFLLKIKPVCHICLFKIAVSLCSLWTILFKMNFIMFISRMIMFVFAEVSRPHRWRSLQPPAVGLCRETSPEWILKHPKLNQDLQTWSKKQFLMRKVQFCSKQKQQGSHNNNSEIQMYNGLSSLRRTCVSHQQTQTTLSLSSSLRVY